MYDVDIMMIGHFAKDKLVVGEAGDRSGRSEIASGGGVYYGSIALRRIGLRVAVVTRLHLDDFPRLDELRQEGVQVFATAAPGTSGIENIYDPADLDQRVCRPLGFAGPFRQEEIPDLSARVYMAVPIIAGEVDLALLRSLAARGPVGLDVQGFVRFAEDDCLVSRQWPDMAEGLALVTYLKVDLVEAELLTGQTGHSAGRQLADYGPREVILTRSSGVAVYTDGQVYEAPFTPRSLAGRTGRGDTCFATYVGTRLSAPPEEACRFAAAVTTLKQEQPGPWRGTPDDVRTLLAQTALSDGREVVAEAPV
jgi:sugar/nucleoside kinase (ribokinase family)